MQFKNNTKQRNVSIQGLRSFKDTLPKNVKRIIDKKGHIYSETLSNWKYIVGADLFNCCYPKTFFFLIKFSLLISFSFFKYKYRLRTLSIFPSKGIMRLLKAIADIALAV